MSRINILSSEVHADNLVVGWDPASKLFFAMVDDSDEPTRWDGSINSVLDVAKTVLSWGQVLPAEVIEKLALHKLRDSEEIICFDLGSHMFIC